MFEGYGVGLTVASLGLEDPGRAGPPGVVVRPSRLSEVLPAIGVVDAEKALELSRIGALEAVLAAYKAFVVRGLAADRPDAADPAPGAPGAGVNARHPIPGTSEFFIEELAVVTNTSARAAARLTACCG